MQLLVYFISLNFALMDYHKVSVTYDRPQYNNYVTLELSVSFSVCLDQEGVRREDNFYIYSVSFLIRI